MKKILTSIFISVLVLGSAISLGATPTFAQTTYSSYGSSITSYMSIGSRGEQVKLLQQFLIEEGYLRVAVSGYFGPMTMQAVRSYQQAQNLPVTGVVDSATMASINARMYNGNNQPCPVVYGSNTNCTYPTPCNLSTGCTPPSATCVYAIPPSAGYPVYLPSSVRIISPNGGETYQIENPLQVTWCNQNVLNNSNFLITLRRFNSVGQELFPSVPLAQSGVALGMNSQIVSGYSNSGAQTVMLKIPSSYQGMALGDTGTLYKLHIEASNPNAYGETTDDSDGFFSIRNTWQGGYNGQGYGQVLPAGCTSSVGYSYLTGQPCNNGTSCIGYSPITGLPCTATCIGYSPITGQPCTVYNGGNYNGSAQLTNFQGNSGVFQANSQGLTSVRIYYTPMGYYGNYYGNNTPVLFGSMNLVSNNGSYNANQTWSLSAYQTNGQQIQGTNIYAVGYVGEQEVNRISIPYTGPGDTSSYLYQ